MRDYAVRPGMAHSDYSEKWPVTWAAHGSLSGWKEGSR